MSDLSVLGVARSQVTIRTGIYASLAADEITIEGLDEESLLRALPEIFAQLEADGETARVRLAYAGFPSGAVQLTEAPGYMVLIAEDFYEIVREAAIATLGQFKVTAISGAPTGTIQPGDFVVRYGGGSSQILYENTEGFTPIVGTPVDVAMTAQVAGAAGNIGNNATLALVTSYPGLSVTNPVVSGTQTWITRRGRDAETLPRLKARCDQQWANLSFDTAAERFARIIADAFEASDQTNPITRIYVDDTNPDGPGSVWVYMARDSLPATAEDVALVDAYVTPRYKAGSGPFASKAASTLTITINGSIKGPADSATALTQASAALAALEPTYAIGGDTVTYSQVHNALFDGVTGAIQVTLDLDNYTPITAGSIVSFSIGTLTVTP